nr:nucleoside-diphosphate sugar epimerase/dehydratase [uncultured Friedmanniella sp.]
MPYPILRQALRVVWDCASWVVATVVVVGARYDYDLNLVLWSSVAAYVFACCLLQVLAGSVLMLYRGRYRIATFEESLGLALTVALVGGLLAVAFLGLWEVGTFPRAIAILTPPVALLVMAAGRWCYRAWRERVAPDADAERVLIYGAGDAGYQLLRLIAQERRSPYRVVGFLDDAKHKRNLRLLGVPVLGGGSKLAELAAQRGASTVILAIPNADSDLVRRVSVAVERAGLRLLVLPAVQELIDGRVHLSDVREVDIADLLGRHQVQTDLAEIAGYLNGRVVLVTGAGGSIGAELARQVHSFGPRELVMLDRDESGLHAVQLSIYGQGLLDTPDMVLCDIRDEQALDEVFARHRPEVVFHAAALKHLPMLEQYPDEGWKTNVLGTLNVLRASARYGCSTFVNISTDKAADPTSVLGTTKRLAERLTAWYAVRSGGTYLSVRFGNVLGSRGSMLHTFTSQIQAGGPVTVTHPDVTRYFMTIPEACELTIQAAAIGEGGEVLVLDMGEPVKILDVAKRLVTKSRSAVDIVFTGLRPGEKLHEVLFSENELGQRKRHPQICHVAVPPLDPAEVPFVPESLALTLRSARYGDGLYPTQPSGRDRRVTASRPHDPIQQW